MTMDLMPSKERMMRIFHARCGPQDRASRRLQLVAFKRLARAQDQNRATIDRQEVEVEQCVRTRAS